jgi:hypothetical protein
VHPTADIRTRVFPSRRYFTFTYVLMYIICYTGGCHCTMIPRRLCLHLHAVTNPISICLPLMGVRGYQISGKGTRITRCIRSGASEVLRGVIFPRRTKTKVYDCLFDQKMRTIRFWRLMANPSAGCVRNLANVSSPIRLLPERVK